MALEAKSKPLTMCHDLCHTPSMLSVNIRELRDTKRLKAWLRAGKTVELRERDEVIARIVPQGSPPQPGDWPDFAALRKEILGDRVLPGADLVIEERGRY
jgi:antitoxin (DNA-binding transcriptional repressor) of toxin-antitoxin stability system